MDILRSELTTTDLYDVIDSTVTAPNNLNEEAIIRRKQAVREIITSHLDDKYYKKVLNIKHPVNVIKKIKRSESSVSTGG